MGLTRSLVKLSVGGAIVLGGLAFPASLTKEGIVWGTLLAQALASVVAGNTANAIDALIDGKDSERVSLENADLTRAVGKAIAAVITIAAKQHRGKTHDNLEKIAIQAKNNWVKIAQQEITQQRYPQLREAKLDQFLTPEEYSLTQNGNLSPQDWQDIFIRLNMAACKGGGFQLPSEVYPQVAELLYTTFPKALRETLKEDFAKDGKAFAGFTLQLLTGMKAELAQLQNTNLGVNAAELSQILQQFQQSETQLRGTVAQQQAFFSQISQDIDSGFAEVCQQLGVMESNITGLLQNLEKRLDALDEKLARLEAQGGKRQLSKQEYRHRQALLSQMGTEVESRLAQSLHHAILLNLGKEQQPHQVQRPWDVSLKVGEQRAFQLPAQTSILEVFDNPAISGKFLILGKPGSGKTTTLLELAQALIERAETDSDAPIPVILELSEWRTITKRNFPDFWNQKEYDPPAIKEWILSQLQSKGVSQEIGEQWIREKELVLLLDGLDELPSERQAKCVQAINQFLDSEFSPLHLVVGSRKEEYEKYEEVLHLNGAICLEDLTVEQMRHYFASVNLGEFWESIKDSEKIVNFIRQPLFLAITSIAYKQIDVEEWKNCNTEQNSIDYLLGIYRIEMLNGERKSKCYKIKNLPKSSVTQNRLIRLSQYLEITKITEKEFMVQKLQPSILFKKQGDFEVFTFVVLVLVLVFMIFGKFSMLNHNKSHFVSVIEYLSFVSTGLTFAMVLMGLLLLIGTSFNYFTEFRINGNTKMSKTINFVHQLFLFIHLIVFLLTFLLSIIIFTFFNYNTNEIWIHWIYWNNPLVKSSVSGIWLAILFNMFFDNDKTIKLIQRLGLNLWITLAMWLLGMMFIVSSFLFALISSIIQKSPVFLLQDYLFLLSILLSIITGLAFVVGFLSKEEDLQETKNQNIILNSFITSIILFIVGMLSGIIPNLRFGIDVALGDGIILGLIFSLLAGFPCIQYLTLRLNLWWNGYMPWNITRFLDYCTERLILQRVGNRYRFIHRLVQEHFANLEIQKE